MTAITLPPINIGTAVFPSTAGLRLVADKDIRVRDLEVARIVLEAAAKVCRNERLMFGDEEWRIRCNLADELAEIEVRHG